MICDIRELLWAYCCMPQRFFIGLGNFIWVAFSILPKQQRDELTGEYKKGPKEWQFFSLSSLGFKSFFSALAGKKVASLNEYKASDLYLFYLLWKKFAIDYKVEGYSYNIRYMYEYYVYVCNVWVTWHLGEEVEEDVIYKFLISLIIFQPRQIKHHIFFNSHSYKNYYWSRGVSTVVIGLFVS